MTAQAQTLARDGTLEWLLKFHSIGDSLSVPRLREIYARDAILVFGNNEPLVGRDAIEKFFTNQFALLESMKHTIEYYDTINNTIYQAATIQYVVKDDPEQKPITIKGMANFFRKGKGEEEESKVERFEVYLDPAPLGERMRVVSQLKEGKEQSVEED